MLIELHSLSGCPFCERAKEFLADRNLPFTETKHDDRDARMAWYDAEGVTERTMPQVFVTVDGERERIGGYDKLVVSGIESLVRW